MCTEAKRQQRRNAWFAHFLPVALTLASPVLQNKVSADLRAAQRLMKQHVPLSRKDLDAVVFDLDGVITQTATVHAAAWKRLFDEFLREQAEADGARFEPFDADADYLTFVDGKPRYDGIRDFLKSRGIELPWGDPSDPADRETVCGLGNRKNAFFREHLRNHGVSVFDSTVKLVGELRAGGFRTAVISASKNCEAVLEAAGVADLFETRVDGIEAQRLNLPGKPAPDVFLEAARRLEVDPARTAVVEDAQAGVAAGKAGGFALVIGVDRSNQAEALKEAGADVVVEDLEEVFMEDSNGNEKRIDDLPDGMDCLGQITQAKFRELAVFIDYDGTLSPIVERPEDADLSDSTRAAVDALAKHCKVAIVSGRDLADVRERVGLEDLIYAGSHGFDIAGPGGLHMVSDQAESFLPALDQAEKQLHERLDSVDGAFVERKKFSIAIHYRRVAERSHQRVKDAVKEVAGLHENLRQGFGKMVLELQPKMEWHKGKAILWLLETLKLNNEQTLPVYLGDDITDEDAFRALPEHGIGIAVKGGDHSTAARFSLRDTDEVREFLSRLAKDLSSR